MSKTTNFDAISKAESRLEIAKRIAKELSGETRDLSVRRMGEFTIVEDGQDRWIQHTEDYNVACENFLETVLEGGFDRAEGYEDTDWYSYFCQECGCVYSQIGSPSNKQSLIDELGEGEHADEILELFGIKRDEDSDE